MPKGLMLLALSCGMQNASSAASCEAVKLPASNWR